MISIYLKILLLSGGFFLLNIQSQAKVVKQDRMIFKVARTVYSQNDLLHLYANIYDLSCMYPDSLLFEIFRKDFSQKSYKLLNKPSSKVLTDTHKNYFLRLMPFMKLLIYAKSQAVVVNPSISKYMILSAKNNSCSKRGLSNGNSLTPMPMEG